MDRIDALQALAEEAERGDLVFPTSARLALKAKQMLDNPRCHIDTASRLVQADPLLAARTVALANSVAYNPGGREVTNVRSAIGIVGFGTVRMLAAALVTRQMAGILERPEHHALAIRLWEHAIHVAALARVIARQSGGPDPETAMFAGIVHEVGGFYLLSRAADYPDLIAPAKAGDVWEGAVGRAVLKTLGVPASVTEAIEYYWRGRIDLPARTLGDILLLADELAPVESPLHPPRAAPGHPLAETAIAGDTVASLLLHSAQEVESLTRALRF